ncbi:hypothetical protein GLOTRDRAFT_139788, partial [Gloeophyllum trabeum ATCC 11539]
NTVHAILVNDGTGLNLTGLAGNILRIKIVGLGDVVSSGKQTSTSIGATEISCTQPQAPAVSAPELFAALRNPWESVQTRPGNGLHAAHQDQESRPESVPKPPEPEAHHTQADTEAAETVQLLDWRVEDEAKDRAFVEDVAFNPWD